MKKFFFLGITCCTAISSFGQISGANSVCEKHTTALSASPADGIWESSDEDVATIATNGSVTGVKAGQATISYTVSKNAPVTKTITVNANPVITGSQNVVAGLTITLTSDIGGGAWSSSAAANATIASTGVVSGITEGTTIISYTGLNTCATGYPVNITHDPTITLQPKNTRPDKDNNATLYLAAMGTAALIYQWQVQVDRNFGFQNVPATSMFSGGNTSVLSIINPDESMIGYNYRCHVSEAGSKEIFSDTVTLKKIHKKDSDITDTYSDSSHYRFMIGTNFDFVNGKQPLSLYYHLQFFLPGAYGMKKKQSDNEGGRRYGFIAGFYQNKQVSQLTNDFGSYVNQQGKVFNDSVILKEPLAADSNSTKYTRVNNVQYHAMKSSTINGLYFEPTYRLWHIGKGTDLYGFGHLDILYNVTESDTTFTYARVDSPYLHQASLANYTKIPDSALSNTNYNYQFYYGLGLMLHHKNKYLDAYIKMMWGAADLSQHYWCTYYATEIGANILPINVMFGVEYRGVFNQPSPSYYNIYLSKVFSLDKIASLIGK